MVKPMSFLGWGKSEEVTDRPVTRSGQLTEEARKLAAEKAEEKKRKKEERKNGPKLENPSLSGTENSGDSSIEEKQTKSETNMHLMTRKMEQIGKEPQRTYLIYDWNVTQRRSSYGSRC